MLAASVTDPNPPQNGPDQFSTPAPHRLPPTPQNWRGVGEGLKNASRLFHHKLFAQAEDALLQLLEFAPMEGRAWHLLGRNHQAQERHAKALECFERAACCYNKQNNSDIPPTSIRIARLLWDQGETSAARDMLGQLIARQPEDASLVAIQQDWEETVQRAVTV